jgi:sulfur relay (sulfurtransferase) DsrC/TusE family protein
LAKQQTKEKAKDEEAYINYHVQWAEDERQTIAKKNNNTLGLGNKY